MKFSEYRDKLQQNAEYTQAKNKLKFRFRLSNAVLRARINKGWSQGELAVTVGTKQANISRIEAGLANPTLDLILRICEALEIDLKFTDQENADGEAMALAKESKGETTSVTIPADPIRVDDQPDNLFCHQFKMSPNSSTTEGVLK